MKAYIQTMCGHCIANCPLLIDHVDNIIDMRRYLAQVLLKSIEG